MREFGFLWPIMVNGETRRIVAGNGRYLAAVRLGLPVVPVVEELHLTPLKRRALIIADNKIALNSGWANDFLAEELPGAEGRRHRFRAHRFQRRAGACQCEHWCRRGDLNPHEV